MKKYTKPEIFCEEFLSETVCTACMEKNPTWNEVEQCGYAPPDLGFTLFADSWVSCDVGPGALNLTYCYHPGVTNLFGS